MKAKLILLAEPILVSDERAQEGFNYDFALKRVTSLHKTYETHTTEWNFCRKIIAGIPELPSIVNALSEEDCKKIGWVDVKKLAELQVEKEGWGKFEGITSEQNGIKNSFIEGFKACQSLNEKKFSKEEIKPLQELLDEGYDAYDQYHHLQVQRMLKVIETFIQSVSQPKMIDVEVEMEQILANGGNHDGQQCEYTMCYFSDHKVKDKCLGWCKDQPKITNNSIKVIKVL